MTGKTIILVCGLPGSGKTYFAANLAERLGAAHISSDRVRDEMGMKGKYTPQTKEAIYEEMRKRMISQVKEHGLVIVDATFFAKDIRQRFYKAAEQAGADLYVLEVVASDDVIRRRVSKKREESEADYDVYLKLRNSFDPIAIPHLRLSSDDEDVEKMIQQALDYIGTELYANW